MSLANRLWIVAALCGFGLLVIGCATRPTEVSLKKWSSMSASQRDAYIKSRERETRKIFDDHARVTNEAITRAQRGINIGPDE